MERLRLCLAGSGGGHVRQLLDLQSVWQDQNVFFVTEPTALGTSIAANHQTFFVDHFAWGQGRLGKWRTMIGSAWRNMCQSALIIQRERPDFIISTGAGSMAPLLLFGRLRGARIVVIDSFARFQSPSLFARLTGWLAHARIAQSKDSGEKWRGALVFDPFVILDQPRPSKQQLAFATVGATLPFDRLVEWTERAYRSGLLPERVVIQTGKDGRTPSGMESHKEMEYDKIATLLEQADIVICHGGTGSIITALQRGCHVIVIPREFVRGEHYDDHQSEIAEVFAARGLLQLARDYDQFTAALTAIPTRTARCATTSPQALAGWLRAYIEA